MSNHIGADSPEPILVGMTPRERYMQAIKRVADKHKVTLEQVLGASRLRLIVKPRREAMHTLHQMGLSLQHIGRIMNRDHTTVFYNLRQFRWEQERALSRR